VAAEQKIKLRPRAGLLYAAWGFGRGRHDRRSHESQPMEQHDRSLRSFSPNQLASFSLAILHVNISAGIFQTAILERAIDINSIVKHQMLVFEGFVFVSGHG
jgi:hypothetical protein